MKTKFTILIVGLLLFAEPTRCFAEYGGVVMSKALAKEMGVLIQTEKNGDAGIRVRMEFKATGKLKQFAYVELRVGEGEHWTMSAPLRCQLRVREACPLRFPPPRLTSPRACY